MRGMKTVALLVASLGTLAFRVNAADLEVMTQNQYVGTDLIALVSEPDFNAAVVDALKTRAATRPTERMVALARLIHVRAPALVALEEVYRFTCVDAVPRAGHGCGNPEIAGAFIDQLDVTLAALHGRYRGVGTVVNVDLPASLPAPLNQLQGIPISYDGGLIFVGVTDRDVILARSDVTTAPVPLGALGFCKPSADGCNYQAAASAPLTISPDLDPIDVRFERGFVAVDATVAGKPYRFVATHLETRLEGLGPQARGFQSAQAYELLQVLGAAQAYYPSSGPQVLAGDFNSDPHDPVYPVPPGYPDYLGVPAYRQLWAAGFADAWTLVPAAGKAKAASFAGLSCCQWEDLSNRRSDLYERIDQIWASPTPKVRDAKLLGESIGDKTPPKGQGLWPSDHASVAVKLSFPR